MVASTRRSSVQFAKCCAQLSPALFAMPLVAMLLICLASLASAADHVMLDPPLWLRDPATRGPLAGAVAFDDRWTSWSLNSGLPFSVWSRGGAVLAPDSSRDAVPTLGLALSLAGVFDHRSGDVGTFRYSAILDHEARGRGGWLGLSSGATGATFDPGTRLRIAAGVWRGVTPFQIELGMISSVVRLVDPTRWVEATHTQVFVPPDYTTPRDTTFFHAVEHVAVWTTSQCAMRARAGRVELELVSGVTLGDAAAMRRWAQGTVRMQLSRHVLVLASAGQRPMSSLAFDATAQPRTMLGLQFAPWSSSSWSMANAVRPTMRSWIARPLSDGRVALHLRCRDTHVVDLAADFTDWVTVRMTPIGGGWWEAVLSAEPGMHQVRVRLDRGAWEVPPGLPHADEGLDTPTGVLLIGQ